MAGKPWQQAHERRDSFKGEGMSLSKSSGHARKSKSFHRNHGLREPSLAGTEDRTLPFHQPMQTPVLVLNASYEPINICGARRALVLVLKGVARTEEEQGATLHAARIRMPMPSVIRLLEYRRIPHQTRALSRKNILLRDRNTCQYCAVVLTAGELTLDHVLPRSRGGQSTWENLVACCHACNRRKGNQLLHELESMNLLREPRPFSLHTSRHIMRMIGDSDQKWRKYLYY
jgi:5-methylcytosine-specific restriction endonuclease McrA